MNQRKFNFQDNLLLLKLVSLIETNFGNLGQCYHFGVDEGLFKDAKAKYVNKNGTSGSSDYKNDVEILQGQLTDHKWSMKKL